MRKSLWYVNQQHATNYQVGRVLCGGDAVHRHPPSSGLGSNTSHAGRVQPGLEGRVRGQGPRRPGPARLLHRRSGPRSGEQIVARANQSRKDYAGAAGVVRTATATTRSRDGLAKLKEASPEGVALRERLYEALELKNTEFNAHGVELNQRYDSGAVIPDPDAGRGAWPRHRELYLQATTRPGAKLPHAWLVGADGRRVSTLDVTGKGQVDAAHRAGRAGLEARRRSSWTCRSCAPSWSANPAPIDPYGYWRRRPGDRRGRSAPGPPRRLRRLAAAAPPSGTTTRPLHQLQDALTAVLAQPVDTQSGTHPDAPEYSTQVVPITVPIAAPTGPASPHGETVTTSGG